MNVVITGVSRGIGLAITKEALSRHYTVFGIARDPKESNELMQLKNQYPSLNLIEIDLSQDDAAHVLQRGLKDVEKVDLLINNAGVYPDGDTKEDFLLGFTINSYVPFMVTQTLSAKLKNAKDAKVIHLSSEMGSIEENDSGGSYAYRSSKCALNMIHKCLSLEYPWLTSLAIHPGWVKTKMGGESAKITTSESAMGIWKVIDELSPSQSGQFKDYTGKNLSW